MCPLNADVAERALLRRTQWSLDTLDLRDVAWLSGLQRHARQTARQLAERVGLSGTPCWNRIGALEAAGVITDCTAIADRHRVGLSPNVTAETNLTRHSDDVVRQFEQAVAATPRIVSCQSTSGAADCVLQVLVPDIVGHEQSLHNLALKLPGLTHLRSSVVLQDVKAQTRLPIGVRTVPAAAPVARPRARWRTQRRGGDSLAPLSLQGGLRQILMFYTVLDLSRRTPCTAPHFATTTGRRSTTYRTG